MRRTRWKGIVLGATIITTIDVIFDVLYNPLSSIFVDETSQGMVSPPGPVGGLFGETATLSLLTIVVAIFSYFLGGWVGGRMAHVAPGLNGALAAVVYVAGKLLFFALPIIVDLPIGLAKEIGHTAFLEALVSILFFAMVLCIILPVACLFGYIGGRIGGQLHTPNLPNQVSGNGT